MRRSNELRELTAKFDGTCAETGKRIAKGEKCLYCPVQRKVYHEESRTASEWRSAQFSRSWGMADANW